MSYTEEDWVDEDATAHRGLMISRLHHAEMLECAQGCLMGQLAGDALGSLVEFQTPEQIRREYPNGVRVVDCQHMAHHRRGGCHSLL